MVAGAQRQSTVVSGVARRYQRDGGNAAAPLFEQRALHARAPVCRAPLVRCTAVRGGERLDVDAFLDRFKQPTCELGGDADLGAAAQATGARHRNYGFTGSDELSLRHTPGEACVATRWDLLWDHL